jgi:hypothetical protein
MNQKDVHQQTVQGIVALAGILVVFAASLFFNNWYLLFFLIAVFVIVAAIGDYNEREHECDTDEWSADEWNMWN